MVNLVGVVWVEFVDTSKEYAHIKRKVTYMASIQMYTLYISVSCIET